ncbi:MAG: DNA polymerase III subunit beta [Candidatus Eisenbacteria bacterium]|nr:DNA polymerase III subunit beta [Candidatus Eisenbacteria bacterium]
MEFVIDKADLSKTLDLVLHVVPPKTTLPVLSNLLLDAKSDAITVVSTDLDTSIYTTVSGKVEEPGVITVPARRLGEIVRLLPEAPIRIRLEEETRIRIECGETRYAIMGIAEEEFPKVPAIQSKEKISLPAATLRRMIGKTAFAVSKDETRPALNGIFWRIEPLRMEMVATDGYRLAKIEKSGKFPVKGRKEFLVSPKALGQMVHLFGDSDEAGVEITVDNNYLVFSFGETVVYSRLLEGPFPRYEQVIPKSNNKIAVVERAGAITACRRVAILSDTLTHQVQVTIDKETMTFRSNTPDLGEATDHVAVEYADEKMDVGYNALYLTDILRNIDGDRVKVRLDTPIKAALFEPVEQEADENYFCLLMPLRLAE